MTDVATGRVSFAADLPHGWHRVPATVSSSNQTVFAAVRDRLGTGPESGFTPAITIETQHTTTAPDFLSVADVAAGTLAAHVAELVVLDRRAIPDGRGITQLLKVRTRGTDLTLLQAQVHLGIDLGTGGDTLVVQLTCTATADQTPDVSGEFEQFVASFRLRPHEEEGRRDDDP